MSVFMYAAGSYREFELSSIEYEEVTVFGQQRERNEKCLRVFQAEETRCCFQGPRGIRDC